MDISKLTALSGFNMDAMLRQAEESQRRVTEMEAARAELRITGTSPDGMVEATVNGDGRCVDIQINGRAMRGDSFTIADGVQAALNEAYRQFDETLDQMMGEAMGDADLYQKMKSGDYDPYEYLKSMGISMPELRGMIR
ncbi:YbaB/EbfC family nucleoid-associated protein [Longispora sp. NPDC051575]|uniref:YbaB/EbfC family nucleoid-associated protein n=1 Tax=Longispora sp. NPDC051575 TaxID=3154943 RepID=UPI003425A125